MREIYVFLACEPLHPPLFFRGGGTNFSIRESYSGNTVISVAEEWHRYVEICYGMAHNLQVTSITMFSLEAKLNLLSGRMNHKHLSYFWKRLQKSELLSWFNGFDRFALNSFKSILGNSESHFQITKRRYQLSPVWDQTKIFNISKHLRMDWH